MEMQDGLPPEHRMAMNAARAGLRTEWERASGDPHVTPSTVFEARIEAVSKAIDKLPDQSGLDGRVLRNELAALQGLGRMIQDPTTLRSDMQKWRNGTLFVETSRKDP